MASLQRQALDFGADTLKDIVASVQYPFVSEENFLRGAGSFEGATYHLDEIAKIREPMGRGEYPLIEDALMSVMEKVPEPITETLGDPRMQYNMQYIPVIGGAFNAIIRQMLKRIPDTHGVGKDPNLINNAATQNQAGMATFYQGSPHTFDKPDSSFIGTGQGAARYGHGLYWTADKDLAKSYAETVAEPDLSDVFIKGEPYEMDKTHIMHERIANNISDGMEPEHALESAKMEAESMLEDYIRDSREYGGDIPKSAFDDVEYVKNLKPEDISVRQKRRNLYTVDIDDDSIDQMLDLDTTIDEQPYIMDRLPEIAKRLDEMGFDGQEFVDNNMFETGNTFRKRLEGKLFGAYNASKFMDESGIPGSRHFDGLHSDSADNIVTFRDDIITALTRENLDTGVKTPLNSFTGPGAKQGGAISMFDDPFKMTRDQAHQLPWEDRGVWHPVGLDKKMNKPIQDMSRETIEINKPQISQMNIESLKDAYLIGLLGDRTDAGKMLTQIGDLRLDEPLRLEGGRGFMWDNPESAWASNNTVITKLMNSIREAEDMGRRPVGVFMPTKHDASNFNNMLTDTVLQMIRSSDLDPKTINNFNAELRKVRPEWEGIDDPDSMRKLETNGALRHEFNRIAGLKKYQDAGFPSFDEARFAITDPKLMNTPLHQTGMGFGEFTGKIVDNPIQPHRTYNTQLEGSYLGELENGLPRDFFWKDWRDRKILEGKTHINQRASSAARGHPTQVVTPEWIDMILKALQ